VDIDRFAAILASRLSAIVPAGFQVEAGSGMLWYSAARLGSGRAGTQVRGNFGVYGEADEDNLVGLAVLALDHLQDYVSEATGDPWPGTTRQPRPHAEIRQSRLHLWYGDPGDPGGVALACEPIPLTAVS
jgi:hypothetical protein